jgi:hypothetical protein
MGIWLALEKQGMLKEFCWEMSWETTSWKSNKKMKGWHEAGS